jgi:hypothetical protein
MTATLPVSGASILVGICSARHYKARRQAIRESWLSEPGARIRSLFFVGGDQPLENEEDDLMVLPVADNYELLPAKVLAFLRCSLEFKYDWLFKCDDDTYVALDRLHSLLVEDCELIGNEFVEARGSPSGGAGYFLNRQLVERLVGDNQLRLKGAEDMIIGEAAVRYGARCIGTTRLCWDSSRCPRPGNNVVTSHWCSPDRMRAIHAAQSLVPEQRIDVRHLHWRDSIELFGGGLFMRTRTSCCGCWERQPGGALALSWFDWPLEVFAPRTRPLTFLPAPGEAAFAYFPPVPALRRVACELAGSLADQMWQYAHGRAIAAHFRVELECFPALGESNRLKAFGVAAGMALQEHCPASPPPSEGSGQHRATGVATAMLADGEIFLVRGDCTDPEHFSAIKDDIRQFFRKGVAAIPCREICMLDASPVEPASGFVETAKVVAAALKEDCAFTHLVLGDEDDELSALTIMMGCQAVIAGGHHALAWWASFLEPSLLVVSGSNAPGFCSEAPNWILLRPKQDSHLDAP